MPGKNLVLKVFFMMLTTLVGLFLVGSLIANPDGQGINASSGTLISFLITISTMLTVALILVGASIALSLFANIMREGSPINYRKYIQKSILRYFVWSEHRVQ